MDANFIWLLNAGLTEIIIMLSKLIKIRCTGNDFQTPGDSMRMAFKN